MKSSYTLLRSTEIYRGRRLTIIEDTLANEFGEEIRRERVEHPGAVVILPITPAGEIVMIRQWRRAISREILELPAGTLEVGEEPGTCAARELVEETGFRAGTLRSLGTLVPAPGFCNERQFAFVATDLIPAERNLDEDEVIAVCTLSPIALRSAIERHEVEDGKTLAVCLRAVLDGVLVW